MRFDQSTANRIRNGAVREWRLPLDRQPHRVGKVIPIHRNMETDPIAHVRVTGSHKSRHREHAIGAPCPHVDQELIDAARGRGERAAVICLCPPAGHADTLDAVSLKELGHPTLTSYVSAWLLDRDTDWLARRAPAGPHATTPMAAQAAIADLDRREVMLEQDTDHPSLREAALMQRWLERWADRPVWIVTFELDHDRPMFLATAPRLPFATRPDGRHVVDDGIRDEDRGYTGDGVRPVPTATDLEDRGYTHTARDGETAAAEAIDPDILDPARADEARARHLQDVDPVRRAKLLKAGLRHAA